MLLDLLSKYLGNVATEVRELEDAKVERYEGNGCFGQTNFVVVK